MINCSVFIFLTYKFQSLDQLPVRPSQNSKMYQSMLAEHQLFIVLLYQWTNKRYGFLTKRYGFLTKRYFVCMWEMIRFERYGKAEVLYNLNGTAEVQMYIILFFFFCSFCFYSCSSLLPSFYGLDVKVPLTGKIPFNSQNVLLRFLW